MKQPLTWREAVLAREARVDLAVVPGVGHALAEEPGVEPAPQTPGAAAVDRLAAEWFRLHLTNGHLTNRHLAS